MLGNLQNPTSLTLKRSTDDGPDTLMLQKLHEYQCNVFNCFYAEHQLDSEIVRAVGAVSVKIAVPFLILIL